jgi:hypothetical protein
VPKTLDAPRAAPLAHLRVLPAVRLWARRLVLLVSSSVVLLAHSWVACSVEPLAVPSDPASVKPLMTVFWTITNVETVATLSAGNAADTVYPFTVLSDATRVPGCLTVGTPRIYFP